MFAMLQDAAAASGNASSEELVMATPYADGNFLVELLRWIGPPEWIPDWVVILTAVALAVGILLGIVTLIALCVFVVVFSRRAKAE